MVASGWSARCTSACICCIDQQPMSPCPGAPTLAECSSTSVHRTKVWSASERAIATNASKSAGSDQAGQLTRCANTDAMLSSAAAASLRRSCHQALVRDGPRLAKPCTWCGAAVQLREPVQPEEAVAVRRRAVVPAADEDAALRGQEPQLPHSPVARLHTPATHAIAVPATSPQLTPTATHQRQALVQQRRRCRGTAS
jgi:hypothetical protein